MKKRIHIKAPFDLVMEGRETQSFKPGVHVVDEEVANHWYVKAMSEEPVEDPDAITAEDIDDLLGQVETLTARAEKAEELVAKESERATKAEDEAKALLGQVETLTTRVKALEEEAAKAAAESKPAAKAKA